MRRTVALHNFIKIRELKYIFKQKESLKKKNGFCHKTDKVSERNEKIMPIKWTN